MTKAQNDNTEISVFTKEQKGLNAQTELSIGSDEIKPFYAYADDNTKTWYVTATRRAPYKGLILLFLLGCKKSGKAIYHPNKSQPVVGTILKSIKGERLEVVECDWI